APGLTPNGAEGAPEIPTSQATTAAALRVAHCLAGTPGAAIVAGCTPALPLVIVEAGIVAPLLDRAHAYYVASGCGGAIDADPAQRRVFDHLTAGVRDAVVFGAG